MSLKVQLIQRKIEKGVNEMPAMSPAVTKIIELANKPDSLPKDLLSVIKLDPVMTGKILRLINSVLFALPQKVNIIDQAIILLGMNTIKNLALTTALSGMFQRKKSGDSTEIMDELWHHSLGCAIAAKEIAKLNRIPRNQIEEYFTAGLLHDTGKLVLVQYLKDEYDAIIDEAKQKNTPAIHLEMEYFGTTHEDIGETLGTKWNLKKDLLETIKSHHNPDIANVSVMTCIVYLANVYCINNQIGFCSDDGPIPVREKIWERINVNKDQIEEIFAELPDRLAEAKQMIN